MPAQVRNSRGRAPSSTRHEPGTLSCADKQPDSREGHDRGDKQWRAENLVEHGGPLGATKLPKLTLFRESKKNVAKISQRADADRSRRDRGAAAASQIPESGTQTWRLEAPEASPKKGASQIG